MDIEDKSRSARVAILIIILLLVGTSNSENVTTDYEKQFRKSQHKMAHYWSVQILFTPIGIGFNSFVLYLFVIERKTLIKSINVMLW